MLLSFFYVDPIQKGAKESKVLNQLHRRRHKTARGQRLWLARGLCGSCEAKIDDCLAPAQAPAAHPPPAPPALDTSSLRFAPIGAPAGCVSQWALVHKCVMCMGVGAEGEPPTSYTPAHSLPHTVCQFSFYLLSLPLRVTMSVTVLLASPISECGDQ